MGWHAPVDVSAWTAASTFGFLPFHFPKVAKILSSMFLREDFPADLRILDIGCGPGRDLIALRERGQQPVGLDGTAAFVRMARERAGVDVWHQDFLHLDLPDQAFVRDTLGCGCPDGVFERIRIDTQPEVFNGLPIDYMIDIGGRLLVAVCTTADWRQLQQALADIVRRAGEYRDRILADPAITETLSKEEIDRAFSLEQSLRHIDAIFERTLACCDEPSSGGSDS